MVPKPKINIPDPPPTPEAPSPSRVAEQEEKARNNTMRERLALFLSRGRNSTIRTSGQGVTQKANIQKTTILGG